MTETVNAVDISAENEIEQRVKGLVTVEQLPIITEQFKAFKAEIDDRVSYLLSLEVNEDSRKSIKAELSQMRKFKTTLEERRKDIKNQILAPYESFESVYNSVAKKPLDEAISKVDKKIKEIESKLLSEKRDKAAVYFSEYAESLGIDFVAFDKVNLNVTLSVSDKKLREQCKAFLDKVMDDLKLIATQEHKAEILVEYKRTLNVSYSITTVSERFKAIEEEKARELERQAEQERLKANEQRVIEHYEPFEKMNQNQSNSTGLELISSVPEEIEAPEGETTGNITENNNVKTEEIRQLSFTVFGTISQLREFSVMIKKYLNERGMRYE